MNYCHWTFEGEYWKTNCGNAQVFEVDGPDENGYKFCPYCGKPIKEEENEV